ncbi:MAG: hypothetical protein QM696_13965 [Steroidobacteraceae bacterium]
MCITAALAGASLLRRSWRQRDGGSAVPRLAGWALFAVAVLDAAWAFGPARGAFVALMLVPVCALAIVASGLQRRQSRARRARANDGLAPEPLERPSVWWRTTLRWLLAGPIGMIAAMATGIAWAVWVPGEAQTRLLIAGLLVPVLWGGGMAWTLSDNRVLRATAVLVGTAVVGFGISMLRGFA